MFYETEKKKFDHVLLWQKYIIQRKEHRCAISKHRDCSVTSVTGPGQTTEGGSSTYSMTHSWLICSCYIWGNLSSPPFNPGQQQRKL